MTHPIPKMTAIPYREWLEKGMHGEMQYLERHLPKKEDIFLIHPTVKLSLVLVIITTLLMNFEQNKVREFRES
jgi:epoxyqueuosine reductase QueG